MDKEIDPTSWQEELQNRIAKGLNREEWRIRTIFVINLL